MNIIYYCHFFSKKNLILVKMNPTGWAILIIVVVVIIVVIAVLLLSTNRLAFPQVANFKVSLAGTSVVPPVTTNGAGVGVFTLNTNNLSADVVVTNLSSTATSIGLYQGTSGKVGILLVSLPLVTSGNNAVSVGTLSDIPSNVVSMLLMGEVYVNVVTTDHPTGEVRGQVVRI